MFINSFHNFIRGLDKKEFIRYSGIYITICIIAIVVIMVRHIYLVSDAKVKVQQLNQTRTSIQKILTKFSQVDQQKKKVDSLLKDKGFYIQKEFQDLAKKQKINALEKLSKEKLQNGYTEESVQITLTQISTKQLCELLQDIENQPRIYIKFVDITKGSARKINVSMSIATLIPATE